MVHTTHHVPDLGAADRTVKERHRKMWASGDYPAIVRDIVSDLGPILAEFTSVSKHDHVLDVAAGTGNASIAAALRGADVVASDLTPEHFTVGRSEAARAGVTLSWETADAEALPFDDGEFDVVLSCIGVMFAPHHELAAAELTRVTKPGGTIGLASWTPDGFIGQMFRTMKPYSPPPPPGAQPAPLWGDAGHVRGLLGDRVGELRVEKRSLRVSHFRTGEELRDYYKANYGPTIAVYASLSDKPEQAQALDRDLVDLTERFDIGGGEMDWEYLLVSAIRDA